MRHYREFLELTALGRPVAAIRVTGDGHGPDIPGTAGCAGERLAQVRDPSVSGKTGAVQVAKTSAMIAKYRKPAVGFAQQVNRWVVGFNICK